VCAQGEEVHSSLLVVGSRDLGSNERLLFRLRRQLLLLDRFLLNKIALRSNREVGLLRLLSHSLGRCAATTKQFLSLGSVVTNVLLRDLSRLGSVLACNCAKLLGLGVDHVRGLLQVVIDKLLVRRIDERCKEGDSSCDQGKTPVRDNLDEVIRQESSNSNL
jgi:hypothetical protein